jgi:multidrug resistance efflux pump
VRNVYVHEGDYVEQGSVVADLEDWEYRGALGTAQAKYQSALSEANRALAANDEEQAGMQRVGAQYWAAEVQRLQERLEKTRLRSPISGKVLTPHPENLVGRRLSAGDNFAEVADSTQAVIDVAIDDSDLALVRPGAGAAVKLESYPQKTFRGTVGIVSLQGQVEQDERVFYARVNAPNPDGSMRPGMQGRGKVSVGWHSVGMALLRRPTMWLYSQLWSWLGW